MMEHGSIACGILVFASLIFLSVADDKMDLSPAGLKMCELLCHQTVACSSFSYSSEQLGCRLLKENSTEGGSDGTFNVFSVKKISFEDKDELFKLRGNNCPPTALIFQRKRGDAICRTRSPSYEYRNGPKLLVLREGEGVKQLDIRDYTVSPYLDTFELEVADEIAYIPVSKKFFFKVMDVYKIASFDLRDIKVVTYDAHGVIGVAEDRVFFFKRPGLSPFVYKYSMSPYGTNLTQLTMLRWEPFSIAVDIKRKNLYIGRFDGHYVFDYFGHRLSSSSEGNILFIEPYSDLMYSHKWKQDMNEFHTISLVDNTLSHFVSVQGDWLLIGIIDNRIYVADSNCNIMILSKVDTTFLDKFKKYDEDCEFCIVTYD